MEEARIKMVGDETWAKENVVTGITRLVRENGLLSTFGGLPAMLAKQVPPNLSFSPPCFIALPHHTRVFSLASLLDLS